MPQNPYDPTAASDDPLSDQLKEEARRTLPPFSPALHQRIMHATGQSRVHSVGPTTFTLRWWLTGTAAAALVLSVSLVLFIMAGQTRRAPQPASQATATASIEMLATLFDRGVTQTPALVADPIAGQRWAYLDEDVISLVERGRAPGRERG